jgi:hypothetical protein
LVKIISSSDPAALHSQGALLCSEKRLREAYLSFAEALFVQRNQASAYGHLFRMACCMTQSGNFESAYPLFHLSLEYLKSNRLFCEFFAFAKGYLTPEIIRSSSSLFIISDDIFNYSTWLEKSPFLLMCLIDMHKMMRTNYFIELLSIKILNKKSVKTIICFSSRNDRINELNYQLTYILQHFDCNVIYVRDIQDSWYLRGLKYLTNGTIDTVACLQSKIESLLDSSRIGGDNTLKLQDNSEITTIGCSSGGFAALLFGNLLGARRIIAFAPQTLLPRPLPLPDTKCLEGVDPTYFDLLHSLDWCAYDGTIDLFYDREFSSDRVACERMKGIDGLRLHPFAAGKVHNIAAWLKTKNLLLQEINQCFG